jgi:NADH:ubiquinone oxidoreductase subunit 5 (subunit L)/multisubunit Na+/H+ antiporter MnhA subunit
MHFFSVNYSIFWKNQKNLYFFLLKKWYFDNLYNKFITLPLLKICYNLFFKTIDKGIIELLGPTGISNKMYTFSKSIKQLQTGFIFNYIFVIISSVVFFE